MSARLILPPRTQPPDATLINALLTEKAVVRTEAVRARIDAVLTELASAGGASESERSWVVATGTPPVHGGEGRIDFEPDADPRQPAGQTPTADHYSRASVRAVHPGAPIGRVVEPSSGSDGLDVTGRSLAARQPRPLPLLLDDSIQRHPDGRLVATVAGTPDYRPPLLRIRQKLELPGFVDFSTGHVDFPGDVEVAKGVRDVFKLHAGGSLLVHGLVEAAELVAGLDATLPSGMAGKQTGRLTAWRDVDAFYLHGVTAAVGRDLRVGTELIQCEIAVGRRLLAERATVAGGELRVAAGATVASLGSPARVSTRVELGVHPVLDELRRRGAALLPRLRARVEQAQAQLDQLRGVRGRLSHSQAEALTELEFALAAAEERERTLAGRLEEVAELARRHTRASIVVRTTLHAGVVIGTPGYRCEVRQDVPGPVALEVPKGGSGRPVLTRPGTDVVLEAGAAVRIIELPPEEVPGSPATAARRAA